MKTVTKVKIAKFIFNTLIFFGFKKKNLVKRNSINWSLDLSEGIDLSIFLFGSFQGEIIKSIVNVIFKNKIQNNKTFYILDIGSNIGDKSLSLTKNLIDKKIDDFKIFSIEPTDYAFDKQSINLNLNPDLKKKISLSKLYISNTNIKKKSTYSSWKLEGNLKSHKIHKGVAKEINKKTKNISLDKFIKNNGIKDNIILKIDVDGFELNVLKSCVRSLKKYNLIIFMEYAPYALKEYGSNIYKFNNFIKEYNYKIFDLDFKKLNQINVKEGSSKDIILIKGK
jgi:FkbM family methyltransferase